MGDVLPFVSATSKRKPSKVPKTPVVLTESRSYLPLIHKIIGDWKQSRMKGPDNREYEEELAFVTKMISGCYSTFIHSGGQWRGRWPVMVRSRYSTLADDCAWQIEVGLLRVYYKEFTSPWLRAHEVAWREARPPEIMFNRDRHTLITLIEYSEEVHEEIERQGRRIVFSLN